MNSLESVVITGLGVEVPGLSRIESLLTLQEPVPAVEFDPTRKLGRQGLRYKDRATKLALCAVYDALLDAGLLGVKSDGPGMTGVAVSSNLGNVDTVCHIMQTVRQGSVKDLSPMDVPNASSNVIATTVAIRFGCRAVNLMLCNGATSGIDVLYTAANVIRVGRARRVLVVGVEPRNEFVDKLVTSSLEGRVGCPQKIRLADSAACLVLESASAALERSARIYGALALYSYGPPGTDPVPFVRRVAEHNSIRCSLWLTANQYWAEPRAVVTRALSTWEGTVPMQVDLNVPLGELYGALGVFQGVAACLWLQQRPKDDSSFDDAVLATSGGTWGDGTASMVFVLRR